MQLLPTTAQCRSKAPPILTAMTCIRKNLSGWSAAMNRIRQATPPGIVCTDSLRRAQNRERQIT